MPEGCEDVGPLLRGHEGAFLASSAAEKEGFGRRIRKMGRLVKKGWLRALSVYAVDYDLFTKFGMKEKFTKTLCII